MIAGFRGNNQGVASIKRLLPFGFEVHIAVDIGVCFVC
jgi:hypothetical protein